MPTPAYVLRPQRRVHCTRCPCTCATDDPDRPACQALVYVECGCPPWVDLDAGAWAAGQEFGGRGAEALHESATCAPVVPASCPRCKSRNWTRPRLYVQGQGTSATAQWRRRRKIGRRGKSTTPSPARKL